MSKAVHKKHLTAVEMILQRYHQYTTASFQRIHNSQPDVASVGSAATPCGRSDRPATLGPPAVSADDESTPPLSDSSSDRWERPLR